MYTSLPPPSSTSPTKIKDSGGYFLTPYVSTSMSMRNRYELNTDHWCNPTSTLKLPLSPAALLTFVWQPQYNVLYQFNIIWWYVALPTVCLGMKIASVALPPGMNPNWFKHFMNFSVFLQWVVTHFEFLII